MGVVWLVIDDTPYDGGQALAVYRTKELADAHVAKFGGAVEEWTVLETVEE